MDLLKPHYSRAQLGLIEDMRSRLNVAKAVLMTRLDQGLSQEEVGRLAGTKQSRISEIESSKGNVRFNTLDRIARALGLMVDLVPRHGAQSWAPPEYHGKYEVSTQGTVTSSPMSTTADPGKIVLQSVTDVVYG